MSNDESRPAGVVIVAKLLHLLCRDGLLSLSYRDFGRDRGKCLQPIFCRSIILLFILVANLSLYDRYCFFDRTTKPLLLFSFFIQVPMNDLFNAARSLDQNGVFCNVGMWHSSIA